MNEEKINVLVFGLMMDTDIFEDGIGITEEDLNIYQNAASKIYGINDKSSKKDRENVYKAIKEDLKLLVAAFREKVKKI